MKPSIKTLSEILYSQSQYVIPIFQRNYRWETPQWTKLWASLNEIQKPGKSGNHFMGFLVFVPGLAQPGQYNTFHLVDGQQRLTTSSVLLVAIRNVAKQLDDATLAEEIHNDFLIHPRKKGDQAYRVLPKERDHDSYLAIVSGNGEPKGRIADALAHFEDLLVKLASDEPSRLRQVFDTVCHRFEFMCASLEAENAYNIFKSLNSTGVPLGPSDLIRNFVFMHVAPDEQDEFDHNLWNPLENRFSKDDGTLDEEYFSRFFRDFSMSGGSYISPKDTFSVFESTYEATGFSPNALAQELTTTAGHYAVISGEEADEDELVSKELASLNVLESSTTYPLLLNLFKKRASGAITTEQLSKCIKMLCGFILRRFVCGESSRGYGQMFLRAVRNNTEGSVGSLEAFLLECGWPDDQQFKAAFVAFPLYQRGYTKEVLEALERARGHKEPADLQAAQVEHVLPQTLNAAWFESLGSGAERIKADWLHQPGNLTLSGYNQELWNHPFEKKRARYADSNIVITRELESYSRWGEEEIRTRGEKLAQEAVSVWIGPKEQLVRSEPVYDNDDEESPGRQALRLRFWSGLSDYLVSNYPELPIVEARPSWTIRIPSGLRHIGFEVRFGLRHQNVGLDIWFWRDASQPAWERIKQSPGEYNKLVGAEWEFATVDGRARTRMSVSHDADVRNEDSWIKVYRWLGETLSILYVDIVPRLREKVDQGRGAESAAAKNSGEESPSVAILRGKGSDQIRELFDTLEERICALDESVKEVATNYYVAFRVAKNFAEVHIMKNRLRFLLRPIDYSDPLQLVEKIPDEYNWTLDRQVYLSSPDDLDYVFGLVEQSYKNIL